MTYNLQGTSICLWYNFSAHIWAGQNKMSALCEGPAQRWNRTNVCLAVIGQLSANSRRVRTFAAKQSQDASETGVNELWTRCINSCMSDKRKEKSVWREGKLEILWKCFDSIVQHLNCVFVTQPDTTNSIFFVLLGLLFLRSPIQLFRRRDFNLQELLFLTQYVRRFLKGSASLLLQGQSISAQNALKTSHPGHLRYWSQSLFPI